MINVIDLKKSFGNLDVLNGITTDIKDGEKVVVIGPSGSGKSTFLRCLNCMEDATSGSIIFDGVDIADMSVDINIHRRHMGMVFQQFNLFANKTVLQNIMLAPVTIGISDLKKIKRKAFFTKLGNIFRKNKKNVPSTDKTKTQIKAEAKEKALALLERIGLADKADVYPSTLSGGQKQRLLIARAVAGNPDILILDDSSSALDYKTDAALRRSLADDMAGTTTVIVAQRVSSVKNSDLILVIDEGRIIGSGTHAELLENCSVYREISESQMGGAFVE